MTKLPQGENHWLAPARLVCTTRAGGVSQGVYAANNLGLHVEDDADFVLRNREQLLEYKELLNTKWLNQVHGTRVLRRGSADAFESAEPLGPTGDAMFTTEPGVGLAILTADCLPVVLVDKQGELVAAAHAGWRGLCAGVLTELLAALPVPNKRLRAFIGPAIGQAAFQVGPEVVAALDSYGLDLGAISAPSIDPLGAVIADKYQVDLAVAATLDLNRAGVTEVSGGHWCTYSDERFYSFRRETHQALTLGATQSGTTQPGTGPATGRQATLVWLPASR